MVNLFLDTNAWIYLANGFFNIKTKKQEEEEEYHFQIAKWILDKIQIKECRIFSNYIIKVEWNRNKENKESLINHYENKVKQNNDELKSKRKSPNYSELAEENRKNNNELKEKITKNKKHIQTIEEILNNSIEIQVTDEQKLKTVDLAIHKRAPLHRNKNSVADAIIFLSAVDHFSYDDESNIDNTIFVSNNTSDFCDSNKELLTELDNMLKGKPIIFETNLAKALDLGDDIIADYQNYFNYCKREYIECLMDCKGIEYGMAGVEFNNFVKIEANKSNYKYNPNQLLLNFGDNYTMGTDELKSLEERNYIRIYFGECHFCNATHIRCDCGEVHASYGDDIECSCGKLFSIKNGIELINDTIPGNET